MAGRPKGSPNKDKLFRDALRMQLAAAHSEGKVTPGPRNRRSEMWMLSRDWLTHPASVDIPDLDSLQADACGPGYHYDSNQRLLLESKEQMHARGVRSPDEWDAVALTFAEPVSPHEAFEFKSQPPRWMRSARLDECLKRRSGRLPNQYFMT